jgi:hypothetical protein
MDFRVTIKAYWNRVLNIVRSTFSTRHDMVKLYLDTTKLVAYATPAVTMGDEFTCVVPRKGHRS